jgi:hypothetical protein
VGAIRCGRRVDWSGPCQDLFSVNASSLSAGCHRFGGPGSDGVPVSEGVWAVEGKHRR